MPAILIGLIVLLAASGAEAQSSSARYRFTTLLDSQRWSRAHALPGHQRRLARSRCSWRTRCSASTSSSRSGAHATSRWSSRTRSASPTIRPSATTASPRSRRTRRSTSWGRWRSRVISAGCHAAEACAELRSSATRRGRACSSAKGGPLTTIAHTKNLPGSDFISEFIVADVSVNSFGKVALAIELRGQPLFDQGLFVGSKRGTFDERFRNSTSEFDSPSSRMSINELGQVAFQDNGIVLSNPDGTFRRIVDSNSTGLRRVRPFAEHLRPRGVHGLHVRGPAGDGHLHEPRRSGDDGRRQHRAGTPRSGGRP